VRQVSSQPTALRRRVSFERLSHSLCDTRRSMGGWVRREPKYVSPLRALLVSRKIEYNSANADIGHLMARIKKIENIYDCFRGAGRHRL
jgi:hypothetical protein